jgi:hypothetical protein
MEQELSSLQEPSTKPQHLNSFTGRYYNVIKTFSLDVSVIDGELSVSFQESEHEIYTLKHSHGTVVTLLGLNHPTIYSN